MTAVPIRLARRLVVAGMLLACTLVAQSARADFPWSDYFDCWDTCSWQEMDCIRACSVWGDDNTGAFNCMDSCESVYQACQQSFAQNPPQ